MANQLFAGFVRTGAGVAVQNATVELFDRNTTTPVRASTTTDANGYWAISHATEGRFDVRITNGLSISFLSYDDSFQVESIETATLRVRNPADTFDLDLVVPAITADRQLNFPLITGTDTLVAESLAATLLNKTLTSPVINTQLTGTAVGTGASQVSAGNHGHSTLETARFWCHITAAGALSTPDFGVSTVTDTGVGDRTINFTTSFTSAVFAVTGMIAEPVGGASLEHLARDFATGSVRVTVDSPAGGAFEDFAHTNSGFGNI